MLIWNRAGRRVAKRHAGVTLIALALAGPAAAQVTSFGGNAQHTSTYAAPAQDMNAIRWSASIDENNTGTFTHYGSPLVTASNTVITGIKIAGDRFKVRAFDGPTGAVKYTLPMSDYVLPSHNWIPVYNPAIVSGPNGTRLYYAGAGGTIFHVDGIDSNSPGQPVREVFYTTLSGYLANAASYNSTIFVNTPIISDAGNVFFGFRVQNTAPAPLSTTQSGYARIDANGVGSYVLVGTASGDSNNIARDAHNSAPALSNDGATLYAVAKSASSSTYGYLLALDSTTLSTKSQVFLRDPRNTNGASLSDDATASPMVGPDGDVFLGVLANPSNGSRGWLLHFNQDLSVQKAPGAFGWDFTPGVVPASMVPGYNGPSTYLLASKYNNYVSSDGNGVNKIAILDPNSTQTDFHSSASGLIEMREVLTIIGPTPDSENPNVANAVREWCINAPAVNPATNSVFMPSEDGRIYRWNLAANSIAQSVALTPGIGEPYVPTVIGPDGTIYTLNGGNLFALGQPGTFTLTLDSSAPSVQSSVAGNSITFTANLASGTVTPTGTVTFTDLTYNGLNPVTTTLATVSVDSGHASHTTAALQAGGAYLGNHWITAAYSGDSIFPAASITRVQKVHADSTATTLTGSPSPSAVGQTVTFTATVTSSGGVPTGYVTFLDGSNVIGQRPLSSSGVATFSTSSLSAGAHAITAAYYSDTSFASSIGATTQQVTTSTTTTTTVSGSPNPATFGQSVTFTATVAAGGGGTPTGTVTFTDGTTTLGSAAVDGGGHAAINVSTLTVGGHTVLASFAGSGAWQNSSGSTTENVQDGTSTSVAGSPNPSSYQQSVTFTATVTPAGTGAGTPVGSVTFKDGATTLATVAVDSTGRASFSTSSLTVGSHTINASFAGSGGWLSSSGSTSQTVNGPTDVTPPNPVTGVTATPGPPKRTITVKWSATTDPGGAVAAYLVYSSSAQNGTYNVIATVTTLSYANASLTSGTVHWYYIVARDTAGNLSAPSAKVSANAK